VRAAIESWKQCGRKPNSVSKNQEATHKPTQY